MYRVIVCGGREYANQAAVWESLDILYAEHPDLVVVQGGARGADKLARDWAHSNSVPLVTYEANWKEAGKRAGPQRNHKMLSEGAQLVVAFPGGRGTEDMVKRALAAKVPTYCVTEDN